MGRLEVIHSNCLCRILGMKLMHYHMLETIHEQCGTSSLSLADPLVDGESRSALGDGPVEQLELRQGHRNIQDFSGMYSSAIWGCHEVPARSEQWRQNVPWTGRPGRRLPYSV
eukprot:366447-Chlamydomonas_euryale.AAC.2